MESNGNAINTWDQNFVFLVLNTLHLLIVELTKGELKDEAKIGIWI